jgi:hypothetical protein
MTPSRRFLAVCLLFTALLGAGCAPRIWSPEGAETTVVLIRHAERTAITKELTEAGQARARALPEAVADLDIAAIYSPDLPRNIDTVVPLAQQRGLAIILLAAEPDANEVARLLVSDHPGKTVLWVGNITNLDRIHSALGGKGPPPVEYGDLYILRVPHTGRTKITRRHFGD